MGRGFPCVKILTRCTLIGDAIGQVIDTDFQRILKSAVVLFPAQIDSAYQTHAFYTSLSHGIGGLPLLPGDANTLSALKEYIKEHILS